MTISSNPGFNDYICNGSTTDFPFTFKVFDDTDLKVFLRNTDTGAITNLAINTHYTVDGAGDGAGGTVTTLSAYDSPYTLHIRDNQTIEQQTDLRNQTRYSADTVETELDRLAMIQREQQKVLDRCLKIADGDTSGASVELEYPDGGLDEKVVAFDADGNVTASDTIAGGILVSAAMEPVVGSASLALARDAMGPWTDISVENRINVLDPAYGAVGDGITDDRAAIQAAIDAAPDGSVVVIPGGKNYKLTVSSVGPNDWWTADGEAALDTPFNTALAFRGRKNLTVIATGATFDCDDEYTVTFYKCANCQWIGGKFDGDLSYKTGTNEASAILIERCLNVWVRNVVADKFYRNIFIYHCDWSGAEACRSTDAGYFCYYGAGNLGVALTGEPPINGLGRSSDTKFVRCVAYAGKYGNFLLNNSEWHDCDSFNAGRQGVQSFHVRTDNAGFKVIGGSIFEGSNQNSGDIVDGISVAAEGVYVSGGTDAVDGVFIGGGLRIRGCRYGIQAIACSNVTIDGVEIRDFYLGGIYGLTRNISTVDYDLVNFNIGNVNVGPFNSASTLAAAVYASKGAVIIEANDSVAIKKAMISGAVIDGNNGGAIAPTSTWYELKCNDSNVTIGNVLIRGTGTQQRTDVHKLSYADKDISTTGAQAINGVGFKPKKVSAIVTLTGTGAVGMCHGLSLGAGNDRVVSFEPTSAKWLSSSQFLLYYVDSTNYAYATMTSLDDDGFTITWSKIGSPTGTVRINYICER